MVLSPTVGSSLCHKPFVSLPCETLFDFIAFSFCPPSALWWHESLCVRSCVYACIYQSIFVFISTVCARTESRFPATEAATETPELFSRNLGLSVELLELRIRPSCIGANSESKKPHFPPFQTWRFESNKTIFLLLPCTEMGINF